MNEMAAIFVLASYVAACSVKVDRLPAPGESLAAESFHLEAGGKGLNVAIALLRLGVSVTGLVAIGNDLFGTLALAAIAKAGLPEEMICRKPLNSGAGVGLIDNRGETVIAVYPGANGALTADDVTSAQERLRGARFVVAQFEVGDAPIAAVFRQAAPEAVTVLNPSPFRPITLEILLHTDIVVLNLCEAGELALSLGIPGIDHDAPPMAWSVLAEALFRSGVSIVAVTRGDVDALLWERGRAMLVQPSFAVRSVDGIGAGDAFLAGLITTLSEGRSVKQALLAAAACGAMVTLEAGVVNALPTAGSLMEFLANAEG